MITTDIERSFFLPSLPEFSSSLHASLPPPGPDFFLITDHSPNLTFFFDIPLVIACYIICTLPPPPLSFQNPPRKTLPLSVLPPDGFKSRRSFLRVDISISSNPRFFVALDSFPLPSRFFLLVDLRLLLLPRPWISCGISSLAVPGWLFSMIEVCVDRERITTPFLTLSSVIVVFSTTQFFPF